MMGPSSGSGLTGEELEDSFRASTSGGGVERTCMGASAAGGGESDGDDEGILAAWTSLVPQSLVLTLIMKKCSGQKLAFWASKQCGRRSPAQVLHTRKTIVTDPFPTARVSSRCVVMQT